MGTDKHGFLEKKRTGLRRGKPAFATLWRDKQGEFEISNYKKGKKRQRTGALQNASGIRINHLEQRER